MTDVDSRTAWATYMLSMGVVATEAEAHELIDKCAAVGVDPQAVADVVGRWNARASLADMGRISDQLQQAALDIKRAGRSAPRRRRRARVAKRIAARHGDQHYASAKLRNRR